MNIQFYNMWKGNPTWSFTLIDIFIVLKGCQSFDITLFNFTISFEWGKWIKKWKDAE